MNFKYPLLGAAAIMIVVFLSGGLLWLCHGEMLSQRNGRQAVWRFIPLAEGTRFPLSPHHLYPIQPVEDEPVPEITPDFEAAKSRVLKERRKP
ncbi:MAG TPA: hypothetical protein EYO33_13580 [Phycisphaerales bacterium]|nr:hypothetical protein [Phycisphaerales bacterium]